ncbi:type I site-specific restriction-modification system R (restriction) subunit [Streptomyces sp. W4I9-2]|nr:type I site-specific restriction-modification system R (restriction) subunit [Streptomyces sp. W4I9-2]
MSPGPVHSESAFGSAIVAALTERGWREVSPAGYQPDLGLDAGELFEFIRKTQAEGWHELRTVYGDATEAERGFARRLDQAIANDGLLHVLRNGVKDRGVLLRVAYFKPNLVADDSVLDGYRANRLTIVRELVYATKQLDWGHKLDLTLFLNGIPVATAELKNPLTGQGVERAMNQYRTDRDPTELIFTRAGHCEFRRGP